MDNISEWREYAAITFGEACDAVAAITGVRENMVVAGFSLHVHLIAPDGTMEVRDVDYGPDFPH